MGIAVGSGCLFPALDGLSGNDAAVDAPFDATQADTSTDGTVDAGDAAADVSPQRFCATLDGATFCDDFDDLDAAAFSKWAFVESSEGGTLGLVDAALSPPYALGITLDPSTGTGQPVENLQANFATLGHAHMVYDIAFDVLDTTTSSRLELCMFSVSVGSSILNVRLVASSGGLTTTAAVYAPDGAVSYPSLGNTATPSTGVWHHVDMSLDLTQTPATVSASIDGLPYAGDAGIPGATFGPGPLSLVAGVYYGTQPTTGWKLRIDNVAMWAN